MSLALSATGHAAMECVMTNMLEPGKTVLIANNGIWGIRSADMARRQGATVKEITTPTGTCFSLDQIAVGIKEHKPDLLFVTHGESSTGVLQPLEGLGCAPRIRTYFLQSQGNSGLSGKEESSLLFLSSPGVAGGILELLA